MTDGTKEFVNKLSKEEKKLLKEILHTPQRQLLEQVKYEDLKEKQSLINMIATFKKLHRVAIVDKLTEELEKVNKRIDNLKAILK
jgi:hypothetical protein